MKLIQIAVLVAAGLGAAYFAVRAEAPSYRPPVVEETPVVPTRLPRAAGPGERALVLHVEGMCCGGCTGKLYRALSAVEGVKAACVDFDSGTASAIVDVQADGAELARALTFDKYTASAAP
jgi:Cu+-exporting ATPase